jgi:hypothetical protein
MRADYSVSDAKSFTRVKPLIKLFRIESGFLGVMGFNWVGWTRIRILELAPSGLISVALKIF